LLQTVRQTKALQHILPKSTKLTLEHLRILQLYETQSCYNAAY